MPDFDFNCPHCQHSLEASPDISGATVNCPACGKPFLVPAPPVPETSVSAPSTPSVCPSCNSPMPDKSVLCVNCGFDLRTNQPVSAELPPFLPPESAPEGRQLAVGNRNQSALVPKNRGTKQEKKWVKTQFDEFEDITTTDYTQEIFYPVYKAFKLAEESVQFIINLRHVNSKDGESIFIFCNFNFAQ